MSKPLNAIKAKVQALRAYSLSSDRASIKLNQNENPWNLPPEIGSEILRRVNERPWSRYPDFHARALHERLAEFAGWKAEGIIAGNGSNELIQALLMVTVGSGTRVLISEPTFALYRQITTVLGGEVISVPLNSELIYDGRALRRAIESASEAPPPRAATRILNPTDDRRHTLCDTRALLHHRSHAART